MVNAYSPYNYSVRNNEKSPRALLRWFFYFVLVGVAGFGLSFYFSSLGEKYKIELVAKEGDVEYRKNEGEKWQTPERLPLEGEGSWEIRTLALGKAKINSNDGSEISLGDFARLVLIENQGGISWAQTDGEVHYRVSPKEGRKFYKIILSDGEFLILGTDFIVKVEEKDTTVYVLEGKVKATYKDKSNQEAGKGQKIIINPLEKKVAEFGEGEVEKFWIEEKPEEEKKADNNNQNGAPASENNNENLNQNSNTNSNSNGNQNQNISVGGEKSNSNGNQNQNIESSAVRTESSASQTETTSPSTSSSQKPPSSSSSKTSGQTTRAKCDDSGGHWTKETKMCKCPPGENFINGRCKR